MMSSRRKSTTGLANGMNSTLVALLVLVVLDALVYVVAVSLGAPYPELGALIALALVAIVIIRIGGSRRRST
jgi:hypothetical protein